MNIQSDPFSEVRLKSKQSDSVKKDQENSNDPFSNIRIKQAEGFPGLYETGRHAARIGSRIAETIGGIPGDVSSLIQSGVLSGLEKITGHKISPKGREESKKLRSFPTSEELQELSEEKTKGFTKAQNEYEKTGDEIAKTLASLLGPMKFRKALGVAIGSESAKEGLKILGTGEGTQEAGKLGSMFLLSTINPKGALKYASSQYDKANQLAKGASVKAILENPLSNLREDLHKGVTTSSKNAVIKPINDLLDKVKNGKIAVDDLTAAKRDLNTLMGDPLLIKREKQLLKTVGREIDNNIRLFENVNPAFKEAYRPANEIYGAVMQGGKASNFVKKTLGSKSVLGAVMAETLLGHPEAILPTIGVGVAARVGAESVDFLTRVSKSKELRKYYGKALYSAAKEDASALRLYERKIQDYLSENQ